MEIVNVATKAKPQTTRQQVADILVDISWQALANRYFSKSASWLYHKLDGRDVNKNGKPAQFSPEELEQLRGALVDLSERIRRTADNLQPIVG